MIDISLSTIVFTIINLIVLFLLLRKFLIGPINKVIQEREDMIRNTISDANEQKSQANMLKQQYEETLAGVDAECQEMREKSRAEAKNEYSRIIDKADAKSVKMIKDAEKTIEIKQNKALSQMQSQIAELAMVAAGKIVCGEGGVSSEDMYDTFLSEVGDTSDSEGN
jgi:F-type H+-transporting ATPase subunit b